MSENGVDFTRQITTVNVIITLNVTEYDWWLLMSPSWASAQEPYHLVGS